jgi:hypothetical protein
MKETDFRIRGTSVSRVEAFSDGVFALAVTLVIVGDGGTRSFVDVQHRMETIPATGACFATIYAIWARHFVFFRRFGLEDGPTRVFTGFLLFVVALYAYPLKFVCGLCLAGFFHVGPPPPQINNNQVRALMALYGAGWAAVHFLFAGLYWHASRCHEELHLSSLEMRFTRLCVGESLGYAAVGVACVILAYALPLPYSGFSGFVFFGAAIVGTIDGHLRGEARKRLTPTAKKLPGSEPNPVLEKPDVAD